MEKKFVLGVGFSCDITMGTCFHPCGRVYQALGSNPKWAIVLA